MKGIIKNCYYNYIGRNFTSHTSQAPWNPRHAYTLAMGSKKKGTSHTSHKLKMILKKGMVEMKMTIDIEPKPAPRPRFGRRAYMPAEYVAYKEMIGALVKLKCKTPTTDNLKLQITFRRAYRADSRRYGDIDNLVKGVMDACNGILFNDDSQVVSLTAEKVQSHELGIDKEIEVLKWMSGNLDL